MTMRITMTAVALAALTLAACNTTETTAPAAGSTTAAPAVGSSTGVVVAPSAGSTTGVVVAPSVGSSTGVVVTPSAGSSTIAPAADITRRPGFDQPLNVGTDQIPGAPASSVGGFAIDAQDTAADITRRPGFDQIGNVGTDRIPGTPANAAVVNAFGQPVDAADTAADITRRPGFSGNAGDEIPGEGKDLMVNDAMAAPASSTNAAFDACFAGGGQVVNFIGDPTGTTMACETDGVQTIIAL